VGLGLLDKKLRWDACVQQLVMNSDIRGEEEIASSSNKDGRRESGKFTIHWRYQRILEIQPVGIKLEDGMPKSVIGNLVVHSLIAE
jgi:hypothetical protein